MRGAACRSSITTFRTRNLHLNVARWRIRRFLGKILRFGPNILRVRLKARLRTRARRGGAIGLVKEADGGTLFLDEIGDMPVALQAVLLRLLDDWTVRPVGGVRAKVDVFLVSATNASLDKAIAEGRFRSDLLYRLNTLEVTLPKLRDRSDFEAIVHHLLGAIDPNCEITPATIAHLAARAWPGNIRELRNMLARFTLAKADGFIDEAGVEAVIDQVPLTTAGSLHEMQRAR